MSAAAPDGMQNAAGGWAQADPKETDGGAQNAAAGAEACGGAQSAAAGAEACGGAQNATAGVETCGAQEILAQMRLRYSADRFAIEAAGAQIDSCGDGYAVCSLEIGPAHVNGHGIVMGGVSFTLADFAFAVACDAMRTKTVTLSSSVQFLAAPKGRRLIAEARRVREGRNVCFYTVAVTDDLGRHVAEVSVTGHRVSG